MIAKLLKNKKGESLIETLAAILVFTMASIALYSMVTTAAGINIRVHQNDVRVQQEMEVAEKAEGPGGSGKVYIDLTIQENGHPITKSLLPEGFPFKVYRKQGGKLFSYFSAS